MCLVTHRICHDGKLSIFGQIQFFDTTAKFRYIWFSGVVVELVTCPVCTLHLAQCHQGKGPPPLQPFVG